MLQIYPGVLYTLTAVAGLCVGSFLNVAIYRLPIILHRHWKADCLEHLKLPVDTAISSTTFNLLKPRSHCPKCKKPLKAWHNIPLLSYIFLKGKCAYCASKISWRYPLIELSTAVLSLFVVYQFGYSSQALFGLIFTWSLLCIAMIDADTQLIPDDISLSLLWLGLLLSANNLFTNSYDAIIGVIAAYLSLWLFTQLFKLITGKVGMGHGDFKLFAVFGAWLGWQVLPLIIFAAALIGTVISSVILLGKSQDKNTPIPFGPYLCLAAWLTLFWGKDIINYYLLASGFNNVI